MGVPKLRDKCVVHNKHCLDSISGKNVSELIHEQLSDGGDIVGGSEIDQFKHDINSYVGDFCTHCKISIFQKLSVADKQISR